MVLASYLQEIINKARSEAQEIISQGKASALKIKEETLNDAKEKAKGISDDAKKQIHIEKEKVSSQDFTRNMLNR